MRSPGRLPIGITNEDLQEAKTMSDDCALLESNRLLLQEVPATADIMDDFPDPKSKGVVVLPPVYRSFGKRQVFAGPCVLVSCFEDNSKVKQLLESSGVCPKTGHPQVLVVNGGGSSNCALLGDMIAKKAVINQWAGVIIDGCVRDVAILATLDLGVLALGSTPRKSLRQNQGSINPSNFTLQGMPIGSGHFVYADHDGVVILPKAYHSEKVVP